MSPSLPTATTRVAAVIGDPIRHSISPIIHNAAFRALDLDWVYVAFPVISGRAAAALDAMRTLALDGLSVTMPHKDEVAANVDHLVGHAAILGAVNCVSRDGDVLSGHNTDGDGFVDGLELDHGVGVAGTRCMVLGAGGAARAVIDALARRGATEVVVVNRTRRRADEAAELAHGRGRVGAAGDAPGCDLIVNATPLGMGDNLIPLDVDLLRPGQVIAELVYHPSVTPLMVAARQKGLLAVGGLEMLVRQAAAAFAIWTGVRAPVEVMLDAAREHISGS